MRELLILGVFLSLLGCSSRTCDLSRIGTDVLTEKISELWLCDKNKVYNFLVVPISEVTCKVINTEKNSLKALCPVSLDPLLKLGESEIISRFSCDPAKVHKNISSVKKICDLLSKQETGNITDIFPTLNEDEELPEEVISSLSNELLSYSFRR